MANTKSAKKSIRVARSNRKYNLSRTSKVKSSIKGVLGVVKFKSRDESIKTVSNAQKQIDKAVKNGSISKNKANRLKSSLVKTAKSKV